MRLWHQLLIPKLPRQQLLGQHRECCALRGLGWGKPHSVVNYVFDHSLKELEDYHALVMQEMEKRGYNVTIQWWLRGYRGKQFDYRPVAIDFIDPVDYCVYKEHDECYLNECIENLKGKGIFINVY